MSSDLRPQIDSSNFVLDSVSLGKIMEEVRTSFINGDWVGVLEWREKLYYELNKRRFWIESAKINQWAIEAAQNLKRMNLVAWYSHDLADINAQQGYYIQAEPLYRLSYEIYEQQVKDHMSATKSLHMLSLAQRALGKNREAEALARECLSRSERFGMGSWRAHPLHLLAWIARDQADYTEALKYLTEALQIHQENIEHDNAHMLAQSHYDIARTLVMSGQKEGAKPHILEAIKWSKETGIERIGYTAAKLYGDIALSEGLLQEALLHYHEALDHAQTGPDERRVAEIYFDLAYLYWRLHRPTKALNYFRSSFSQLRRLRLLTPSRLRSELLRRIKH